MSSDPLPSISYPQQHPGLFLGPMVVGFWVQAIETGFVVNQAYTFWLRLEAETTVVRIIAAFVTLVALFQTATVFYEHWVNHVLHYGDWALATTFMWVDRVSPMVTLLMASPVQGFVIYRCWCVTHKNKPTLIALSAMLLMYVISSIAAAVNKFEVHFTVLVENADILPHIPPNVALMLALLSSAVLDVAITIILLVSLSKASAHLHSSLFRRVMWKLTVSIWEAAIPPCVCAVLTVVTYLTMANKNRWDVMFQAILGKLYVITLFVTLNGQTTLAQTSNCAGDRLTSIAWVSNSPVRINVDVESHYQLEVTQPTPTVSDGGSMMMNSLKAKDVPETERHKLRTL